MGQAINDSDERQDAIALLERALADGGDPNVRAVAEPMLTVGRCHASSSVASPYGFGSVVWIASAAPRGGNGTLGASSDLPGWLAVRSGLLERGGAGGAGGGGRGAADGGGL
jgi:hypothetical protein